MEQMNIEIELPVTLWMEDDQFVISTPSLHLATQGDTEAEAFKNLQEAIELFFETALERNVLNDLLLDLGWSIAGNSWNVPQRPVRNGFKVKVPPPHVIDAR